MSVPSGKGGGGRGRSRLAWVALAGQLALAGCYTYVPVEPAAVPPGTDVRIHVDRGTALSVGTLPLEENGRGTVVRGKLMSSPAADSLLCSVPLRPADAGAATLGLRGTVSIPVGMVEDVEVRRLSRTRTFALAGAGAVLAGIIVNSAFDIHNAREGTDNPGNVNNARITLFRLPW